MKQYKLTEAEARALATQIATGLNKITNPDMKFEDWIPKYMKTYNDVMNAIDSYAEQSS